ncbi:hypothetical protein UlMin_037162 [Ulmus minor]
MCLWICAIRDRSTTSHHSRLGSGTAEHGGKGYLSFEGCQVWKPCIYKDIPNTGMPELLRSNSDFIIEANGGLNQNICDVVVVAGLLNATFVIPIFHLNSVRRGSSKFKDIFAEDFFIHALRQKVNVVRKLPEDVLYRFENNKSKIVNLRIKFWSSPTCYLNKALPKLVELGAVRIAPFSNRLAHAVPSNVQGLRCMANNEALRFLDPIKMLSEKMVDRMVSKNLYSVSGRKYVSVHVSFSMLGLFLKVVDMVAFSRCEYDSGKEEKQEMDIVHERSRRGNFKRRGRVIRPSADRVEVGMMLRGMGFDNTTSVYVATGKIYKAEKYMPPLKQMFPRLETKDTLASPQELAHFEGLLSRLAALNYMVCLHFNQKGIEMKKPSGSLYTFLVPNCMCKQAEAKIENNNMSTSRTKLLI